MLFLLSVTIYSNSLAAGTRDGRTLIWDLNGFSIKKTLVGHVAPVTCLDWHSLDRDSLVQNDLDPDHKLDSILKPPSASLMDTNKEELLVSGSSDWNVILWNPKTGARYDNTLNLTCHEIFNICPFDELVAIRLDLPLQS